ncbi:hypothetical protein HKX41_11725, partial [Salinisphaera sp. USBA-960]|nr:hypothetical protein [Salifodinibacter halophilus]
MKPELLIAAGLLALTLSACGGAEKNPAAPAAAAQGKDDHAGEGHAD